MHKDEKLLQTLRNVQDRKNLVITGTSPAFAQTDKINADTDFPDEQESSATTENKVLEKCKMMHIWTLLSAIFQRHTTLKPRYRALVLQL